MKKKKKEKPVLSAQEQHIAKVDAFTDEAEAYAREQCKHGFYARRGDAADAYSRAYSLRMNELTIAAGLRVE